MVFGLNDFGGHDPAHEEDGPWKEERQVETKTWDIHGCHTGTSCTLRTCSPVSDDKEERVVGHDLRVEHQCSGQGDHSWEQRRPELRPESMNCTLRWRWNPSSSTWSNRSLGALLSHFQIGLLHRLPDIQVPVVWNTETRWVVDADVGCRAACWCLMMSYCSKQEPSVCSNK